jgi:hypothetical protein
MTANTGASNLTFLDVLDKLFREEQMPAIAQNPYVSSGFLCTVCKDFVTALDQLQHEVVDVKNSIVSLYKKNEHIEEKNTVEQEEKEKTEVIFQTMVVKCKKFSGSNDLDIKNKTEIKRNVECKTIEKTDNKSKQENNKKSKSRDTLKKEEDVLESTVIESKRKTKETKKLREYKSAMTETQVVAKKNKSITTEDEVYNVEALLEKRGYKYLVKWENYSDVYNSWEPRFALPQFIVKVNSE